MDPDFWIELESTYRERVAQRKALFTAHGKKVLDYMPGSEAACTELAEMAIQFLCARYPTQFRFEPESGMFYNGILDEWSDTKTMEPLVFLLNTVPEDFLIVQKDEKTGLYFFRAGVGCSAVGWSIATKIGKPLNEVHGPVPHYKEKMEFSMDRCVEPEPRMSAPIQTR